MKVKVNNITFSLVALKKTPKTHTIKKVKKIIQSTMHDYL